MLECFKHELSSRLVLPWIFFLLSLDFNDLCTTLVH